jgi:hypothetical protein
MELAVPSWFCATHIFSLSLKILGATGVTVNGTWAAEMPFAITWAVAAAAVS